MSTRRETTKALAAMMTAGFSGLLGMPVLANADEEHGSKVHEVIQHALPDMEDKVASLVTVSYAPGAGSEPHLHPGPVFGYILEGAIVSQVEPEPPVTYRAGEAFYEPPMHVHRISRNASKTHPAKLLAFVITKKGQPLTIPTK